MQLDNQSPFAAIVQVADLMREDLPAVVIIKATFDLGPDGRLTISEEPMPLVPDHLECPFGLVHGELFFKKLGVDLCILGTVRRREPVTHARVRLAVGTRQFGLLVSGDRVWIPGHSRKELEPSRALPFTEMPLGYHRTYGGTAEYNGEDAAYPDNPVGRGYYLSPEQAEGHALPNIEPLDGPYVQRWSDEGKVVGWGPYPMYWALRARANVKVDAEKLRVSDVSPGVFNHAHPDLVLDELATGEPIVVDGLHPERIALRVPPPPARVELKIGATTRELPTSIDGVFVWADAAKVVVTQRVRFDYVYREDEFRMVTVHGR